MDIIGLDEKRVLLVIAALVNRLNKSVCLDEHELIAMEGADIHSRVNEQNGFELFIVTKDE